MKITIDIPKEFEKHFGEDRFKDSLERIKADLNDEFVFAGLYERELLEMLIEVFKNAESVKHGRWDGYLCPVCNVDADYFISGGDFYFDEKPNFCPNCGARMED